MSAFKLIQVFTSRIYQIVQNLLFFTQIILNYTIIDCSSPKNVEEQLTKKIKSVLAVGDV